MASSSATTQHISNDAFKNWHTLYPAYIDRGRTQQLGRRLALEHCVDAPTAYGMFNACKKLGLDVHLELDKRYVSDPFNIGRIKVKLPESSDKTKQQIKRECTAQIAREFAQLEPKQREVPKNLLVTSGIISDAAAAASVSAHQVKPQVLAREEKKAAKRAAKKEEKRRKRK